MYANALFLHILLALSHFGIGHIAQHLQAVFAFAHQRTQRNGNRKSHHASAGNAHAHGVFQNVGTQIRLDVSRCATQRLGSLSHTQRHRHRFRTTDSRHHFTLHQLNNSLSLLLVNHTRRFYKPKHGLMTDLG